MLVATSSYFVLLLHILHSASWVRSRPSTFAPSIPPFSFGVIEDTSIPSLPLKNGYKIDASCDGQKALEIGKALDEVKYISRLAASYLKTHVAEDELIVKYFGKDCDKQVPIATFTRVLKGTTPQPTFRCDDIDGKCKANADWNGHWRDEAAENETVICDLSFETRLDLNQLCTENVTNTNQYWAIDMLHRILHMPSIAQGKANHTAEGYDEMLKLANENPEQAVENVDSLQAFAFEVVTQLHNPPNGCINEIKGELKKDGKVEL